MGCRAWVNTLIAELSWLAVDGREREIETWVSYGFGYESLVLWYIYSFRKLVDFLDIPRFLLPYGRLCLFKIIIKIFYIL